MNDQDKTKAQLIDELALLRSRVARLEAAAIDGQWVAEALRQSETKFRNLTEKSVVGVYLFQDDCFRYVNPKMAEIFGCEVEDVINKKGLAELVFREDLQQVEQSLKSLASGKTDPLSAQFRGVRSDGEIIFVEGYGARTDYNGRPAIIGTLLDVTQRIKAGRALETELNTFQQLYDLAVAMTADRTLEENLSLVVEKSRNALRADTSFIALRDETSGDLCMHTWSGLRTEAFTRLRIPMGTGHGGKVAATGQRRSLEDYFEEVEPLFHDVIRSEGLISGIAVPIKMGDTNLGVLYVYNRTKTSFIEVDLDTLSLLGNLAAVEISRKRAKARVRESELRFRELYEEAKRSEQLYRSLLNASADPIVVYDMNGEATYLNAAYTRVFGWTFEELAGRRIPYVPPENWPETNEMIRKVMDGEVFSNQETRRYTKDGRLVVVSVSGARFLDHEDNPAGFFVILRDISDSKSVEEALRDNKEKYKLLYEESKRSEELYRSLLNSSADAIVIYDMQGHAQYVNPSFTRIFGWTMEEVSGRRIPFLPDSEREASMAIIQNLIQEGRPCSAFETKRFTRDSRILDVSISASRYHDHGGVPAGMLVVLCDITQRKQVEEALRKSEEKYRELYAEAERSSRLYRTLLDVSPEPVVVYDANGIPSYVNPAFTKVFGWTFEELQGKRVDFVPAENWPETRDMIDTVMRGENFSDRETRRYTKDRRVIDVSVSGAVFADNEGKATGSVVHLRDITARKNAEASLAAELKKFQALYDLAVAMIAERSLDENLELVVEQSRKLLTADKSYVALRDEGSDELYMHTLSGIDSESFRNLRIPLGAGLGGMVAQTGQRFAVEDYFKEVGPRFHDIAREEGLFSGIAVPIQIGQTNLGVLYVFNRTKTPFSRADLDTLSLLGNLAAVEITRKRAQDKLRESEEKFRKLYEESKRREELYLSLLNSSPDAIIIYDMEGRAQYVNPSFTRIFGWTLEQVEGRQIPFLPENEREATMAVIRGVIQDGVPCSGYETRRYTKDGLLLDISISASRNSDLAGNPTGTLAILRDITRSKDAEAALRESEERFRTLAEVAPFGLVIFAANESTEYINPKFTELFGYAKEDLPDSASWFLNAYPSERSRKAAEAVWRAETADIQTEYGIGREARARVFAVRCKDGKIKIASFRAVVLPNGRVIATFLDVTAEVEAQEKIIRAKNEWERTFNAVSDLIVILDDHRRIVRANKALADRLHKTPDQVIGLDCSKDECEEKSALALCPDVNAIALGKEYSGEVVDEGLGGVFDLRVSPLHDESGRLVGSVNVARDITAFKSMERARRRAIHHLAHELKTPLAVIKSSIKHLGREDQSEEARLEKIERIRRNVQRLTDIQNIVQDMVAPRDYKPRPFPVLSTTHEILEMCRGRGVHRAVKLVPRLEPIETDVIDPDLFREIVTTLVKNAMENTPDEGEVTVFLTVVPSGVLLQVEDRGVGIATSDRDFVFRAFYHTQSTSSYSTRNPFDFNAGGKGLELMRLKMLSEDGRFEISLESRRCRYIKKGMYECPGRISLCSAVSDVEGCRKSGGTTFSVLFHSQRK
jgi:PAS domain S-box-containing protein